MERTIDWMKSLRRSLAVCLHEARVLRRDPFLLILMFVMPMILVVFLTPLFRLALEREGYQGVTGAEHGVPGLASMFAFFLVGWVAMAFYREYGWGTWDRLRATPARLHEIVAGKSALLFLTAVLQQVALFFMGSIVLGLEIRGSSLGVVLVGAGLCINLVGIGLCLAAFARNVNQVQGLSNIGTIVFGTVGGALVPLSILPAWVQAIAPATPTYWAMRGFRSAILQPDRFGTALAAATVLAGSGLALGALAAFQLRRQETRRYL